ncbi:MAG TPA: hypothetical protein VNO21_10400 [Polyangiaceae bacterium]|nr:hypothetical protein [Polyangiaceae bacterium]
MFNALLFFTGMRKGEVWRRRWRKWDRKPVPLTSLLVDTQDHDEDLKGDDHERERPRMIPVHPVLEMIFDW